MMRCIQNRSHNGFTLIEIIVTLMLVGITAAILFPVMGNSLIKSPEPIARLDKQYRLVEEMDNLTASYRDKIAADGTDFSITDFKTNFVDPIVNNLASYPNIDNANAQYIEDSDQDGIYTSSAGTTSILMVTLKNGDQALYAIFSE